jgi:tetratricopeptide (TPR) repeat protein
MSPYGWYDLGQALFRLRQEGATGLPLPEKFFRRALELDPLNPLFLDGLLRWQLANGMRAEAWETFLALIDSDPAAVGGYGDSLLRSPREVRRLAAAIGNDAEKNLQLARVLYRRKDFELASELLQKLPDQVRLQPEIASLLAAVLRLQDRLDQAEVVLTQARAQNPDNLTIMRDLGPVLIKRKKVSAAMALYRTVIAQNPEDWGLVLEAANAASRAGEYPLAAEWYRRALDSGDLKEKPWLDAILGLAEVQYRKGDLRAALASYQKALEFDPGNKEVAHLIERLELEIDRQEH